MYMYIHVHVCTGTMSGGGGKVSKGRMSSRIHDDVSPQQLTKMESTLKQTEREFEVFSCKRFRLGKG